MSTTTFLSCFVAILACGVVRSAILHSLRWYALRRTACCPRFAHGDGTHDLDCVRAAQEASESLRDYDTFVDGWRACEACRNLTPEADMPHLLRHFAANGDGRWPVCDRPSEKRAI